MTSLTIATSRNGNSNYSESTSSIFFFFNDTAPTEIYTLSLHDALPISPRVKALAVTKVDSADHIRLIAEVVSELEAERGMAIGTTQFIAMIETPDAWFKMPEIAKVDRRIVALTLGGEDFALTMGMLPTAEALFMPKQQLAIAARAAGILPLGFIGTVADYKDLDAFRQTVRRSRRLGFRGASVIHPSQIPILNEEFSPA